MYDDILRLTEKYLEDNNIKVNCVNEYLLPVRIKESGKDAINKCLNILIKDRAEEANKNYDKIKTEVGKALYYYQNKNDGNIKQENLEYFLKGAIENTYYDLSENKYLTKKVWDDNHFVWDTNDINKRVCLFYKRIILDEDVLYAVVSYLGQKLYNDKTFKINGKNLDKYFTYNKQNRKKVYKSEDSKSLTIAEQFILDNLDKICEVNKHERMNLDGIAYFAWEAYYDIDKLYWKIDYMVKDCKKYIESELRNILNDCDGDLKFYKEKIEVVKDNLDYNLMSNRLISCWVANNLENFLYNIKNI